VDDYAEFRRLFDARDFAAAVAPARRVLESAQQQAKTPFDEEVQVAQMNLALAEYSAGDYVAAEASYLRAIELVESSGRPLSARLARANAGLAVTYHAAKRYDLAVQRFEQAVAMSRRAEGLLNTQQVPLLEKYVDSLTQLQRYDEAMQVQRYVLRIETRAYGENDPRIAPALERVGRWYTSIGAYDAARRLLKRAIEVVTKAEGGKSPQLIGPLVALADCNRRQLVDPAQQRLPSADEARESMFHEVPGSTPLAYSPNQLAVEGENALLRAAALADERTEPSPLQIADVRTRTGDWYQVRAQPARALPQYRLAWQAANKVAEKHEGRTLVEILFGQPLLLHYVRPESWNRYAGRPAGEIEVRSATVEVDVDAQGLVRAARLKDDSGDARRGEKSVDAAQTARYRPRFENGQPVATPGIVFTQPWVLLIAPETPAESEPAATATSKP
jgi:Tfp pilus assembly protein PilF